MFDSTVILTIFDDVMFMLEASVGLLANALLYLVASPFLLAWLVKGIYEGAARR